MQQEHELFNEKESLQFIDEDILSWLVLLVCCVSGQLFTASVFIN